jgi:hypothetical protein
MTVRIKVDFKSFNKNHFNIHQKNSEHCSKTFYYQKVTYLPLIKYTNLNKSKPVDKEQSLL